MQRAENNAWLERLEVALAAGEIDEAQWYREVAAVIVTAYLAGDNPRAQSGYSGDDAAWTIARSLIAEAVDRDGSFLDIGCASGYLLESLVRWCWERGQVIEPYGLEIAPELADLARRRLPGWAERIFVGNAIDWAPPRRFDFVRTGLEYVPRERQRELVQRLLRDVVAPRGRLIIGTTSEVREEARAAPSAEERAAQWGLAIAGRVERPHPGDSQFLYRVFWIERGR